MVANISDDNSFESNMSSEVTTFIPIDGSFPIYIEIAVSICGIILNFLVIDVSRLESNDTSGSYWTKFLAFWNEAFVIQNLFHIFGYQVFGWNVTTALGNVGCKVWNYQWWVNAANASAHVSVMAVDRALNISCPIWHYKKPWAKLSTKISVVVTLLNYMLFAPHLYFFSLKADICDMTSEFETLLKVYESLMISVFTAVGHFLITLIANVIFIHKLKHRRKKKKTNNIRVQKGGGDSLTAPSRPIEAKNEEIHQNDRINMRALETNSSSFAYQNQEGNSEILRENVVNKAAEGTSTSQNISTSVDRNEMRLFASLIHVETTSARIEQESYYAEEAVDFRSRSTSLVQLKIKTENFDNGSDGSRKISECSSNSAPNKKFDPEILKDITKTEKSSLSAEDLTAINTVQLVCFWYLICNGSGVAMFITRQQIIGRVARAILGNIARILVVTHCSFTFFFYLRGKTFRNNFRERWLRKIFQKVILMKRELSWDFHFHG